MEEQESKLKSFFKSLRMNESVISLVLGAVVVVVVGVLIYNYFTGVNKGAKEQEQVALEGVQLVEEAGQMVPKNLPTTHKVVKGEFLWRIAEKYYQSGFNWVDIAKENKLTNPDILVEGQELVIPRVGVKPDLATQPAKTTVLTSEYTVEKGDSLWTIAVRAYADGYQWTRIWEANKKAIANPDLIETGMLLKLPR